MLKELRNRTGFIALFFAHKSSSEIKLCKIKLYMEKLFTDLPNNK